MTKEIKEIYRTFWSGMHHYKCEGGGGGEGGVQDFFPNLDNLFWGFLCNVDFFSLTFWFYTIFFLFYGLPAAFHISNGASLTSC